MGCRYKVLAVCALFVLVASLPASAGSIYNFSSVQLTGNSGSSASGSFSFNNSTHTFTNISVSFSGGVFDKITAIDPNAKGIYIKDQGYLFKWKTYVGKDTIYYSILFNPLTNQFFAGGWIKDARNRGGFDYLSVPEGGTPLSYLMLSGFAAFAGILISGKRRRTARSSQSS